MRTSRFCLSLLLILLFTVNAFAGKEVRRNKGMGDLSVLVGVTQLNFVIDYSGAVVDNVPYREFKKVAADAENDEMSVRYRFIKGFMSNCKLTPLLMLGDYPDAYFTLTIKVLTVDDDGETIAKAVVSDKNGKEYYTVPKLHGDGGHYGSQYNLMGDAFSRMGETLGNMIEKGIKHISK